PSRERGKTESPAFFLPPLEGGSEREGEVAEEKYLEGS
ncbi:MAG: hypothetical protein PWP04_1216, partial [Candidatus Atribacteria bacterium]|nr:hypothetical protein [Candidatus Atribacteria bacterium]